MTKPCISTIAFPRKTTITRPLLAWYRKRARDLPWRRTNDPYAIWVSEIMLQQTQVTTVVPYYCRFLKRFPTVEKLSRARLDSVLKLWEGLGYYSRARSMHRAAKVIAKDYNGALPQTKAELLALPGIGVYTAGAIASIAFGRQEAVVDGNVTRVVCRLLRIREDPKKTEVRRLIWSVVEGLVPKARPGDFNQALMELGSEVCLPRGPLCEACPLRRRCQAHLHGEEDTLPARSPSRQIPCHTIAVGVIYRNGLILIDKRPPKGLLGGLWEFPGGKKEQGESLEEALRREVREELDIRIRVKRLLATVDHAYSHFRIRLHAFECAYVSGKVRCLESTAFKWVRPQDLSRYAFPAANTKIIRVLQGRADRT